MIFTMNKFEKFDLHLTNVTGLGAVKLVSCLLPSIINLYSSFVGKVYTPSSGDLSFFQSSKNIEVVKYRRFLPNSISRFLEIFFWRPKQLSKKMIILGDIPLSASCEQILFLHSTLIIEDLPEHNFWQRFKYKLLRMSFVYNLSNVKAVVVQTEIMKALLINKYPSLLAKVYVVCQPPPDIFLSYKNVRNKNIKSERLDSISLFYPSAFYAHKNHTFLGALDSNFGSIKELILTIDQSCNPAPQAEFVKCVGELNIKDTLAYYLEVDALIFLSLTESYGLPLVEAMWLGLPIIVPDLPYARVLCGDQAIYFKIDNFSSFEDAVHSLIEKMNSGWYPDWSSSLAKIPANWDMVATKILDIVELQN